jgi:pimeloyl-ACP methyl ester carboxylesterase
MLPQMTDISFQSVRKMDVPVYLFLGRHDWTTPTAPVTRWFERVTAPSKDIVWFEESAHLCMFEEPGKFVVSLVNLALPHAVEASRA